MASQTQYKTAQFATSDEAALIEAAFYGLQDEAKQQTWWEMDSDAESDAESECDVSMFAAESDDQPRPQYEKKVKCPTVGCIQLYYASEHEKCFKCHEKATFKCQADKCTKRIPKGKKDLKGAPVTKCFACAAKSKPKCKDCGTALFGASPTKIFDRCFPCHTKLAEKQKHRTCQQCSNYTADKSSALCDSHIAADREKSRQAATQHAIKIAQKKSGMAPKIARDSRTTTHMNKFMCLDAESEKDESEKDEPEIEKPSKLAETPETPAQSRAQAKKVRQAVAKLSKKTATTPASAPTATPASPASVPTLAQVLDVVEASEDDEEKMLRERLATIIKAKKIAAEKKVVAVAVAPTEDDEDGEILSPVFHNE